MEKRTFGKTGEQLSMVGFGGILVSGVTPEEASEYVTYAVEEMNATAAWISELGFLIGCGPDASFGCGFLQKLD